MKQLQARSIGNTGIAILTIIFNKLGCTITSTDVANDVGIDGFVELFKPISRESQAKIIAIQSKCTKKLDVDTPDSFVYKIDNKHLDYWHRLNIPMVICFTNENHTEKAYFILAKDIVISGSTTESTKVSGNQLRVLNSDAITIFSGLAQSPNEMLTNAPLLTSAFSTLLDNIDPYFRPVINFGKESTTYAFLPKTVDAYLKSPQTFKFTVDLTEDDIRARLRNFQEKGERLELPMQHLKIHEFPSMIEKFGGMKNVKEGSMVFEQVFNQRDRHFFLLKLRNTITGKRGAVPVTFHILRHGSTELTFSNQEEKKAYELELTIAQDNLDSSFKIRFRPLGQPTHLVSEAIKVLRQFASSNEMTLYDNTRMIALGKLKYEIDSSFSEMLHYEEAICLRIRKIEKIMQLRIDYPIQPMTEEDFIGIEQIYKTFSEGIQELDSDEFRLAVEKDQVLELMDGSKKGDTFKALRRLNSKDWHFILFGKKYILDIHEGFEYVERMQVDCEAASKLDMTDDIILLPVSKLEGTLIMNLFPKWLSAKDKKIFKKIKKELLPNG